jgi:phosphohistidine phosphatase
MKRLLILRHGKSDWYAGAATDHERPLNKRGTGAAMTMGRVLTRIGEQPNLIFTSSAVRARETALLASDAGGWECEMVELDELYGTSAAGALEVAARAPDEVERLMLVGHEPTWSYLVYALTGASVQIKTATLAAVDLDAMSWDEAPIAPGSLAYLLQPKLFTNWEL